jgi:hypothetical protein
LKSKDILMGLDRLERLQSRNQQCQNSFSLETQDLCMRESPKESALAQRLAENVNNGTSTYKLYVPIQMNFRERVFLLCSIQSNMTSLITEHRVKKYSRVEISLQVARFCPDLTASRHICKSALFKSHDNL